MEETILFEQAIKVVQTQLINQKKQSENEILKAKEEVKREFDLCKVQILSEIESKAVRLQSEWGWIAKTTGLQIEDRKDATPKSLGPVIKLNVGGKIFHTSRSTLVSDSNSMLAAMFSGRHPLVVDEDGNHFIDRDGKYFELILSFLRTGHCALPTSYNELQGLLREAEYFQLDKLVYLIYGRYYEILCVLHLVPLSGYEGWSINFVNTQKSFSLSSNNKSLIFSNPGLYLILGQTSSYYSNNNSFLSVHLDGVNIAQIYTNTLSAYQFSAYYTNVLRVTTDSALSIKSNTQNYYNDINYNQYSILPISEKSYFQYCSTKPTGYQSYWQWEPTMDIDPGFSLTTDHTGVTVVNKGLYLVFIRLIGCGSNNNGYAELIVDGNQTAQSWCNNSSAFANSIYFHTILSLKGNSQIKVKNYNLLQSVAPNALNTQFTLYCLSESPNDEELGSFHSESPWTTTDGFWVWKNEGTSAFFKVENHTKIVNCESGYFIVLVQFPGTSSANNGNSEFLLNGITVIRSHSNSSDGHHNMMHFTRVMYLPALSYIQIRNHNISHSWNMGQKLATHFKIYRLYK